MAPCGSRPLAHEIAAGAKPPCAHCPLWPLWSDRIYGRRMQGCELHVVRGRTTSHPADVDGTSGERKRK